MSDLSWFRNRFPYTKLNDINLDWLLKRMKELSALVVSYADDIQRALSQSSTAITQSETAVNSASNAVSIANGAAATADAVSGIAEDARTIANAANTTALHAETVANGIAETAQSALDTAQSAETIAGNAAQAADGAQTTAQNAVTIANGANTRAGNAEQSALTAISTASAAQQTATSAAQSAQTAQQAATTAAQDAETAQQIATTAAQNAQTAQQAATTAAQDAQAAQQAATTIAINKADVIKETISDNVVNFPDGADAMPFQSMVVNIEPVQAGSGDPSQTNIRPLSGWTGCNVTRTGKNLQPHMLQASASSKGYTAMPQSDGTLIITGTWVGTSNGVIGGAQSARFLLKAGQYILNGVESSVYSEYGIRLQLIDSSEYTYGFDNGNGLVFTLAVDTIVSARLYVVNTIATGKTIPAGGVMIKPMIRLATDRDDTFTPYDGNAYNISFPSEAGTVYDGRIDAITAKLYTRPYYASYNGESLVGPWISSMDVYAPGTTPTIGAQVVDMGGAETIYDLSAVPEIDTLYGINNIWADCGPVSLEYRADTKLYIEKINSPSDNDMIANAQITSGKYFIIGGNLYKSTTVIAQGDTIIPGSNCNVTNLADALNSLI